MGRQFIDYGIDLGTTNSCVALFENGAAEVVKNTKHSDFTPSAVFCDENGSLIVGDDAVKELDRDTENTASEFKLQMGSDWKKLFARSGQWLRPEDLSAEVLKSLKQDCRDRRGEEIAAAVITVPAAFEAPQNDATRQAAKLAGISCSPLLQEPVAAALAYGFQQADQRNFWLVYDLGGGTFDAALIKSHDGIIQVINHSGDNHLGGKLMDWAIVEELLAPAVAREHGLEDFRRGSPSWVGAVAKLKQEAEEAKISLSRLPSYRITTYLKGGDGRVLPFEYTLRREQIQELAEHYIRKSITICRKLMADAGVGPSDVEKVLLVGGPTLMPYLRERLADGREGLGIALEYKHNPMTVVAQGAAIFAAMQVNSAAETLAADPDKYAIALDYNQIGDDPEPMVGGQVGASASRQDFTGYCIEFISVEARTPWRSGRIPLSAEGGFTAELWAPEKQNNYLIELTDPRGSRIEATTERMSYTRGRTSAAAPLTHSIGVALANNEVDWFFRKGDSLPRTSRPHRLNSAYFFRKDQAGVVLRVPVVEGEYEKADRNHLIGHIEVTSERITRDLRAGDEVEVELEVDTSGLLTMRIYSVALQEEIDGALALKTKALDVTQLEDRTREIKSRLEAVRQAALSTGDPKALSILKELDEDGLVHDINKQQNAAANDPSARDEWEKRLRELDARIDEVEGAVEIPALVADAQQVLTWAQQIVERHGTVVDKQNFQALQRDLLATIRAHVNSPEELTRKTRLMEEFALQILTQIPEFWIERLAQLELQDIRSFTDPDQARELLMQGRRAVNSGELEKLKSAVKQLWQLRVLAQPSAQRGYGGTLIRG
ncbi:MAG TPA: Hsp70 family protein [Pyrinomonadaceae bacterium]|jgi:molecular chaperone DnaK